MSKDSSSMNEKMNQEQTIFPSDQEYLYDVTDQDDVSYNFFLFEYNLKKYQNYTYVTSTSNSKHTAILYLDREEINFILVILTNNINSEAESVNYKKKSVMIFNRTELEAIPSDELVTDPNRTKVKKFNLYNIFLVSDNSVLLECMKKKIILIDFNIKKYTTLFVNTEIKRSIRIVSTYDELIMIKKKNKKTQYITRTYVFCVSNRQLFFFILNNNGVHNTQFTLHFFPFEEYNDSIEEFIIQRIDNKEEFNKWYYIFIVLLDGKFVRYVTNWVTVSIKQILLNFTKLVKNKTIRKSVNTFDKMNDCHIKNVFSINCVSFLLLQLGENDILGFKYFNTETPEGIKKRFYMGEYDKLSNASPSSGTKVNTNINSNQSSNSSILRYNSPSTYHNINSISGMSSDNVSNYNKSITSLNMNTSGYGPNENSILASRRSSKGIINFNFNQISNTLNTLSNLNIMSNSPQPQINGNENTTYDSSSSIYNFTSKERDVIHYSIKTRNDDSRSDDYSEGGHSKEEEEIHNSHTLRMQKNQRKKIYNYTSCHLCSFTQFSNIISIYSFPSYKEIDILQSKKFYQYKFKLNDIKLYNIFHYDSLNFSYLLTNKFIMKIRYSNRIHSLLMKSFNIDYSPSTYNEDLYIQLRKVIKYESSSRSKHKCKICQNMKSYIKCDECKKVYYCSKNHMKKDFVSFHFFECEIYKFISLYEKSKRKEEQGANTNSYKTINSLVFMVNKILDKIFEFVKTEKDYCYYSTYIKIMLNILRIAKIENFLNKNFYDFQKNLVFRYDIDKLVDRIFNMELWFYYININNLYNFFVQKGKLFLLSSSLFQNSKLYDLFMKRIDNKSTTTFGYFGFTSELLCYDISDKIIELSSNTKIKTFFFDLQAIYTSSNGKKLNVYEKFISYCLRAISSTLKIGMELYERTKSVKIQNFIVTNILPLIPIIFEEKINSDSTTISNVNNNNNSFQFLYYFRDGNYEDFLPQLIVSFCYFFISLVLVRLNKVSTSIKILNYILGFVQQINDILPNTHFYSFQAKILINTGILLNYIGNYSMGIHKIEECYRLCFNQKILTKLCQKSQLLLIMSYINIDKINTAYLLTKESIASINKSINDNQNCLNDYKEYMHLCKLKAYLLFMIEYLGYQYNKSNKKLSNNIKAIEASNKTNKENDFKFASKLLLNYVSQKEAYDNIPNENYNLDDSNQKEIIQNGNTMFSSNSKELLFLVQENQNNFLQQIQNNKDLISIGEFLYELPQEIFDQLNQDNAPIKIETVVREDNHDRSMSNVSKDISMNASFTTLAMNKDNNFYFKEEELNYLDEIEIKFTLYDKLTNSQKENLKKLNNKLFLRSMILRDPKGIIDKFNLNYHPFYSYDYMTLVEKMEENLFLKKISSFPLIEGFEDKIFGFKKGNLLKGLRKFMVNERIQMIIENEKMKFYENKIFKPKQEENKKQNDEEKEQNEEDTGKKKHLIKKIKEKFSDMTEGDFSLGYYDEALDKIFSELSYNEIEYIYDNPKCIFSYIYSETQNKFSVDPSQKQILVINSSSSGSGSGDSSNILISRVSPIDNRLQTPSSFEDKLSSNKHFSNKDKFDFPPIDTKRINEVAKSASKQVLDEKIKNVKINSSSDDDEDSNEEKDADGEKKKDFPIKKSLIGSNYHLQNIEEEKSPKKDNNDNSSNDSTSKQIINVNETNREGLGFNDNKDNMEYSIIKEDKNNSSPFITENFNDLMKKGTRKTSIASVTKAGGQRKTTLNVMGVNKLLQFQRENNNLIHQRNQKKLNTYEYSKQKGSANERKNIITGLNENNTNINTNNYNKNTTTKNEESVVVDKAKIRRKSNIQNNTSLIAGIKQNKGIKPVSNEEVQPMEIIKALMDNKVMNKMKYRNDNNIEFDSNFDNKSLNTNNTLTSNKDNSLESQDFITKDFEMKKKPTYSQLREMVFKKKVNSINMKK